MNLPQRFRHLLAGMGSVLNVAGNYFEPVRRPATDDEAHRQDADALAGDWAAVGDDMQRAIDDLHPHQP